MFYHADHYQSATVGARLIGVRCDRCGFEYFYELARIGSGSASAPYGFGKKAAARSSADQARRDLGERLEHEAELVPCPRCHWISEDLIAGYRRGRYRGWAKAAAGCGFLGTIASLVCAWFVSRGPAADRGALPMFLVIGPATSLTSAVVILLLRNWLRGRIQPNRDHPLPSRLPDGCPPPLVINPASGRLEAAGPRAAPVGTPGEWLDYQIGRHELPPVCCACLLPAAPRSAYRLPVLPAVTLVVPLCSSCAGRWKGRKWLIGLVASGLTIGLGLGVLVALRPDEVVFWIFAGALCLVAPCVGAAIAHRVTTPVRVGAADSRRGVVRLWFRTDEYRRRTAGNDGDRVQGTEAGNSPGS